MAGCFYAAMQCIVCTLCSIYFPPVSSQPITLLIFSHRKILLGGNFTLFSISRLFSHKKYFCIKISHFPSLVSISRLFANSLPHFQPRPICSLLSPLAPYPRTKSCLAFIRLLFREGGSVEPALFPPSLLKLYFQREIMPLSLSSDHTHHINTSFD